MNADSGKVMRHGLKIFFRLILGLVMIAAIGAGIFLYSALEEAAVLRFMYMSKDTINEAFSVEPHDGVFEIFDL